MKKNPISVEKNMLAAKALSIMNDKKRGLGRGLDDLMAQNEIDLPFLSS